ncbi:conserved hypothetical protein [Aspergillus terreus NIH2624]|uniref:Myb-like domain-containing protein n=1 Tax=Aspergillus terreus (strain NIH 2624 / FGSC A1156) TaxID=341663 RepID=Q0CC52_ASPTN|nr:uncharacterized protein ATEG_08732 [Aspergillus terreus NIH2624]EAU30864.1 conserved hypothetical protein [Aspergillus terreus NIH2624]
MDSSPTNTVPRSFYESLIRELPQPQSLRIAPLREPVSSRTLNIPSPLEPNASAVHDPKATSAAGSGTLPPRNNDSSGGPPEGGPQTRSKKSDPSVDTLLTHDPPPKPILPSFVNPRALERFPYSSFDDDASGRKRRRLDVQADSFGQHLQLPIPQAKKEQRPRRPFGPFAIVNGLCEPPPNAALLPSIDDSITRLLSKPTREDTVVEPALLTKQPAADGQRERREGRIEEILDSPVVEKAADEDQGDAVGRREPNVEPDQSQKSTEAAAEPLSPKTRGRSRKNVRKWTEEETTALLRGVVKCGIGNWTAILAQPELKFNKRSASNLKDRFRVCCPWAYRAADPNEATKKLRDSLADALSRAEADGPDGTSGKIHLPHPWPAESESTTTGDGSAGTVEETPASGAASPQRADPPEPGTRAKRNASTIMPTLTGKSRSTLASLGIPEPHVTMKSRRRSRRPFTATEDEALLKGYAVHGFQWTLIQQDKRLNLSHRRATDLRDRFRTKFPHAYRDGGSVSGKSLHSAEKPLDTVTKSNSQAATPPSQTKSDAADQTVGPVDPALSPPAPPGYLENSTGFQFPLDEATGGAGVDAWDNTLAPMMWDELT